MRRRKSDASRFRFRLQGLLADAELLLADDSAVTGDVLAHKVFQEAAALAYKHFERALCGMIFVI